MAGDWIKARIDLHDDPAVVAMSESLDVDEFSVVGRLVKLWGWADKHTSDGVTSGVTLKWVDRYVAMTGFAEAMVDCGWLDFTDGVISFPGFDIHNGQSAKKRCDDALRKRMSRSRHKGVTNGGEKRHAIPRPFIRSVMKRDNYTCVYCGETSTAEKESSKNPVLSVDHIIPISRGNGPQAVDDLATCCKACTNEKNDRSPEEWGLLPTFLEDGVSYKNGTLVTKESQGSHKKDVTREDKRREDIHISAVDDQYGSYEEVAAEILGYLNKSAGKNFQLVQSTKNLIRSRIREGRTPDEIKTVIDDRVKAWGGDEHMQQWLRPNTIFEPEKFNGYFGNLNSEAEDWRKGLKLA